MSVKADDACQDKSLLNAKGFLSRVLAHKKSSLCKPGAVGSNKIVDISAQESPTGVEHKYLLSRVSNDQYRIAFNLRWSPDGTNSGEGETNRVWGARVSNCFASLDGRIRGPNGEKVSFELYKHEDQNVPEPPLVKLTMRPTGRANSRNWTEDMTCPEIFHELLHLVGLVDEYPERSKGYRLNEKTGQYIFVEKDAEKVAFDCRKIYPLSSVMVDQSYALLNSDSPYSVQVNYCEGSPELLAKYWDVQKRNWEKSGKVHYPSKCPEGFRLTPTQQKFPAPEKLMREMEDGLPVKFVIPQKLDIEQMNKQVTIYKWEKRVISVIEPRHFNAILYPGCYEKNWEYYQDSQNAYRTSTANGGNGCLNLEWAKK
ncbi:MAG: hypothetical protein JNJ49_11705 [Bdellovibrionaceae bacterium]|nr:hypothetical protein [Pseudobdellovibrionaceae bacterium]